MQGRIASKACVVTGAASGIGAATAKRFAAEGGSVVCADINLEGAQASTRGRWRPTVSLRLLSASLVGLTRFRLDNPHRPLLPQSTRRTALAVPSR